MIRTQYSITAEAMEQILFAYSNIALDIINVEWDAKRHIVTFHTITNIMEYEVEPGRESGKLKLSHLLGTEEIDEKIN